MIEGLTQLEALVKLGKERSELKTEVGHKIEIMNQLKFWGISCECDRGVVIYSGQVCSCS